MLIADKNTAPSCLPSFLIRASRVFLLILVSTSLLSTSCSHTPAQMRLYCLRQAHLTVKVPEEQSTNREPMVREVYLRCLEAHNVPDAPVSDESPHTSK